MGNVKRFDFTKLFQKQLRRSPTKIRVAFLERYKLFLDDQFNPQLNNHHLIGKLKIYRSINITGDWRALYSEELDASGDKIIIFEILGTHNQLYK